MIDELESRRVLTRVATDYGLIGYRFSGALFDVYEAIDRTLVRAAADHLPWNAHSCTSVMEAQTLERIRFFDTLPVVPLHAIPHIDSATPEDAYAQNTSWILTPSTCYHTFAHLASSTIASGLTAFTARGTCHRWEPDPEDGARLGSFTMREFVLIGEPEEILRQADEVFAIGVQFLSELLSHVTVEAASDIFYGRTAQVARRMQLGLSIKKEARALWKGTRTISVASRNLHHETFTNAFEITSEDSRHPLHSACVAFGIERILLTALADTPGHDPDRLLDSVRKLGTEG